VKPDTFLRAAIGLLMIAFVYVIYNSFTERVVSVGDRAPEFSVTADNGKQLSLKDFGGNLLVLNFWATWCPPCIEEMPSLDRFQRRMASDGVVVLGISVDKNEKQYRDFLARARVSFLTARDPESRINSEYGTFKYPETYVISRSGRVLRKFIGEKAWDEEAMLSDIRSLL